MKLWRKRNEFTPHEEKVNSIKLGRGTGMCLVTGGDDCKVNIWKIGHRRPAVSLSVDSVPIASVSFDASDEYAVSGNRDGCVTVWDIPQEKVGRQFSGHNGTVTAVQYHPSKGYYLISGSEDSSVKIWDVRRKSCLHSFKGNTKQVTQCSFSPDGKWICAGFADGEVKLWDIRTRKLLQCLREHRTWISGIEFHPAECLMATSSFDGSVRLWDLENSETVEKIGPERSPVRCIQFSRNGECLLSALPDGLRLHGWEPYQLHDSVSVPWTNVQDMAICDSQKKLVVCSSDQSQVGVWLVDLKRLQPFAKNEPKVKREEEKKSRKEHSIPSLKMDSVHEMRDSDGSARTTTSGRYSDKYLSFSTERSSVSQTVRDASTDSERCKNKSSTDRTSSRSLARTPKKLDLSELQQQQSQPQPQQSPLTHQHQVESSPEVKQTFCPPPIERGAATCRTYAEKKHCLQKECDRYSQKTDRQMTKKDASHTFRDIHIEQFLPKKHQQQPLKPELPDTEPDDTECIDDMMCKKDMVRHILSSRVCNLQIVRRFWEQGNMQETFKAVQRCENTSVAVDFIGAICPLQKILTLDLIPYLVPVVLEMLRSTHERYWEAGLNVLAVSLKSFCGVIRETINGATMSMGVNISLEQRFEKCRNAQESLLETQPLVEKLTKLDSTVAGQAKDVQCRLADLTT